MGATNFTQYGFGQTMGEAFRSAHDAAAWEYGHGGYSGSLAEKHGAVEFVLPAGMTSRKFEDLVSEALDTIHGDLDTEYLRRDEAEAVRMLAKGGLTREQRTWAVRSRDEARKALKEIARDRARFQKKAGKHLDLIARAARVYDDKWGDAVAVKLTGAEAKQARQFLRVERKRGNVYKFMGMASS